MPKANAGREGHGVTALLRLLTTGGLIGVGRRAYLAREPGSKKTTELAKAVKPIVQIAIAP